MEVFGLKLKKVYRLFELKYLTFFMMLIPCFLTQDGVPGFNVTCDSTGLHLKIAFSKPFTGIVYAKGYRFDPLCSVTESSAIKGSIFLPLSACGTYVQETDHPWITNTVVFQHHPLIRTANDFEKSLMCSLESSENFWDPQVLLEKIYESHSLSPTEFSSGIKFGPDFFHEDGAKILDSTSLTIFRLLNRTIYNDVVIKSCIAHNEGILDGNDSVRHISSPRGCFSVNSENSSGLTIIETDGGFIGYVDIKTLEMETSGSFYLTCEVVFCKTKCKCSEIEQGEHVTSLISHKLTKRSTETSSEILTKQYEARTRFLKSTVKALMDKIVEQRKQNDKKLKIRKRLMRLDDSTLVSGTNYLGSGFAPVEIFSPEPVDTDVNIEPREDYYSDEPNIANSFHDKDENDYDQDSFHGNDENEYDQDSFHGNDENEYDQEDSFHDNDENDDYDSDLGRSRHNHREETTTTELSKIDSDIVFVEKSKESEDNGTKTIIDTNFQEKCSQVPTADLDSPLNGVAENTKTPSATDISFPSVANVDAHLGSCVPRLRFVIVTVVMGFFMGCLLLVSCGMALYIRKEKKRNKINDFLLYSISY